LVYRGLSDEDLEIAKEDAVEAGKSLTDYGRISRTAKYESRIRDIAEKHGVPGELFLGFVMYESEGFANSVSPTGAGEKGLTQMDDAMAQKHGLRTSDGNDDERFDPEKILPASAEELVEAYERLGDWGLAFQQWHVGMSQLYDEILKPYFLSAHDEDLPSIGETPESEVQKVHELYKAKIKQYKVTVYHLFKNPQIQEVVSGPRWYATDQYLPRILGSAGAYYGFETIVKS
jgi:hypothetical protein